MDNATPLRLTSREARRTLFGLTEVQRTAILFLLPALVIFLVFVVYPVIQSARYSLYNWNGIGPLTDFIGLQNYQTLVNDPVFWKALRNNVIVVVWSLVTQIPLAIGLAILLTRSLAGSAFFRTLYFAPLVLSDVIIAILWGWIYQPVFGIANALFEALGLPTQGWLGDEKIALMCVLFVATWKFLGFYIVIYIAAIQGIPDELYEAAQIDGADGWRLHRHITLPMLSGTTQTNMVLITVGSLKFFDLVWILTTGGPSNATEVVATYMFKQAFQSNAWGYGSTLAFVLFLVAFTLSVGLRFVFSRRREATV
jgi:raffinose/stachyose/melibiose transport system permease protein